MDARIANRTVLGQYRVEALIGRGGMGEVYRAYDTTLDRLVALKVLAADIVSNAESLTRFVREARSASALSHPHVVAIYQIGRAVPEGPDPGSTSRTEVHFIAMELVAGETLRALIEARRLDSKRMLEYMAQAADALTAAHAAGIVHRDFKPDNVMIAEGGYAKVLDFGLAKARAETILDKATTQPTALDTAPGAILGTVGYMSPEQAEGRAADHRADIFAFGCVLYEAATGVRAFSGTSSVDTLHRIIHSEPDPLTAHAPGTPPELQRITRKCLAKDPEARYQSMRDVAIDLRELRRELDSTASTASKTGTAIKRSSRMAWLLPLAAALIVAVAGWMLWNSQSEQRPSRALGIERLTGSGNIIDATISPDGKYVAYIESLAGDQTLWLRQLSATQPLRLVPPARAGFFGLTFSKDSSSLFYTLKAPSYPVGQLFQIPLLGGTPRLVMADIDSTLSFSPDGQQITYLREHFPERGSSALMIASATGANARPLVIKRPPFFLAPAFFAAPSWSPDGQRISAGVRNSQTRDGGLVTFDVASGAEHAFDARFPQVTFTSWLPDGSGILMVAPPPDALAVQGGGQIWLQPFPSGEPRRLTNDLVDYRNATISADGRALVSVGSDLAPTLWMIPLDGTDQARRVPSVRYDGLQGLSWLPDGRILFTARVRDTTQISTMNSDGSDRRELTVEGANVWPQVTPDGRVIVLVARRGNARGIWRMDANGANARLLADVPDASFPAVSTDGRTIFFTSSLDGSSSTWRVPIEGGQPTLVKPLFDRAAVSPDGRFLAGIYRASVTDTLSLGVVRISDGEPVHVFRGQPFPVQGGVVTWNADSTGILFTTSERTNIWLQRLTGGEPVRVTNFSDLTVFRADRSPDGRWLIAARGGQTRDAFLITNFR